MNQHPRQTTEKRITTPPQTIPSRPEDTSLVANSNGAPSESLEADEPVMQMEGVYIISVAARILDMHPQTLRKYERLGLINPGRTLGMLRLYSRDDIRRLRLIRRLSDEMGLNLAGVEFALATVENLLTLRKRLAVRFNDAEVQQALDEELELLFESLNLRVDR
jgi:MerR family transcriptional regulator/heat shock protein HspR